MSRLTLKKVPFEVKLTLGWTSLLKSILNTASCVLLKALVNPYITLPKVFIGIVIFSILMYLESCAAYKSELADVLEMNIWKSPAEAS